MCCTLEPAELSDTIIYAAEVTHDAHGLCHVIGYQNTVTRRNPGPNAMLLPFPAEGRVGRDNLVNGADFPDILKAYDRAVERLKPRTKSVVRGFAGDMLLGAVASADYEIFESGSYTIALAQDASGLASALKEIPESKRPNLPAKFIVSLGKLYPDWPMALCCFDLNIDDAEPLFWWYKPRFPEVLFAPAIDAHNGEPPDLETDVWRDHTLAFGSYAAKLEDRDLLADIVHQVPKEHRWLFDAHVSGTQIHGNTGNGDFVISVDTVRRPKDRWLGDDVPVALPPRDRPDKWSRLLND